MCWSLSLMIMFTFLIFPLLFGLESYVIYLKSTKGRNDILSKEGWRLGELISHRSLISEIISLKLFLDYPERFSGQLKRLYTHFHPSQKHLRNGVVRLFAGGLGSISKIERLYGGCTFFIISYLSTFQKSALTFSSLRVLSATSQHAVNSSGQRLIEKLFHLARTCENKPKPLNTFEQFPRLFWILIPTQSDVYVVMKNNLSGVLLCRKSPGMFWI